MYSGAEIPRGVNLIATVNLLTFSDAASGNVFNQRLDGGLGLGKFISEQLQLAITYEMISVRQPRDFLVKEMQGKPLIVNRQILSSLDKNDNDFFTDNYLPALSIKFVYVLSQVQDKSVSRVRT